MQIDAAKIVTSVILLNLLTDNQNLIYTNMKTTKKTTKSKKVVVDLTKAETPGDVKAAHISAKVANGVAISYADLQFIIRESVKAGIEVAFAEIAASAKIVKDTEAANELINIIKDTFKPKKPWYKRLWNWITRKK